MVPAQYLPQDLLYKERLDGPLCPHERCDGYDEGDRLLQEKRIRSEETQKMKVELHKLKHKKTRTNGSLPQCHPREAFEQQRKMCKCEEARIMTSAILTVCADNNLVQIALIQKNRQPRLHTRKKPTLSVLSKS